MDFGVELFRYSKSIYGGQSQMIGASFDLLPWFAAAGVAFILLHAAFKLVAGKAAHKKQEQ